MVLSDAGRRHGLSQGSQQCLALLELSSAASRCEGMAIDPVIGDWKVLRPAASALGRPGMFPTQNVTSIQLNCSSRPPKEKATSTRRHRVGTP